jgi:hypothetical protein
MASTRPANRYFICCLRLLVLLLVSLRASFGSVIADSKVQAFCSSIKAGIAVSSSRSVLEDMDLPAFVLEVSDAFHLVSIL